ncbi:uncharacterized protein JCM6883_003770 [Sporobolomyces salmoneus]|uniref:uncharacterized protein n=1 Tax=Sporobolomyces salmoneus TaxID=183962 RepID=UPI003175E700
MIEHHSTSRVSFQNRLPLPAYCSFLLLSPYHQLPLTLTYTMVAKIAVVYYTLYGHVSTLALAEAEAAKATGAEVDIYRFPEILSDEVRGKMYAGPHLDYPEITPDDLVKYDGFIFGFGTRYGRAPAAASAFFDQTGGLWAKGALTGKMATVFTSSASNHGGQETTALTTVPFFAHHGIIFVPVGFAAPELTDLTEIVGGSAYGAAAVAGGDGSRAVTEKELSVAKYQGTFFAKTVAQFVAGKSALERQQHSGEPALAKALPTSAVATETAPENTASGYEVADKAPEPAATESAPVVESTPTPAPASTETQTPAATSEKPVATPAAQPKQQKKKGGLFSCCGKPENYES